MEQVGEIKKRFAVWKASAEKSEPGSRAEGNLLEGNEGDRPLRTSIIPF